MNMRSALQNKSHTIVGLPGGAWIRFVSLSIINHCSIAVPAGKPAYALFGIDTGLSIQDCTQRACTATLAHKCADWMWVLTRANTRNAFSNAIKELLTTNRALCT